MKKITAVIMSLAVLVCFASCGGDTTEASSEGASSVTSTPVSSQTNITISIPTPTPPSDVESGEATGNNLAVSENATIFDMNEGLEEGDEGYKPYYNGDLGPNVKENAFDGNLSSGWQMNEAPDGTGDMWIGVRFEEATSVDMIVINWEKGSVPETFGTSFKVEYTLDGEEWTEFSAETYERAEGDPVVDTIAFDAMDVKGIRIVLFEQGGTPDKRYTPKLWEFEIYAPVDAEETESTDETVAE